MSCLLAITLMARDASAQSILPDVFVSCPVSEEPPPTDFDIQQRWATSDEVGQRTLPYQTPVVGDLFDNGQPVVVVGADNSFQGGVVPDRLAKDLHIVNGLDGTIMNTIVTPHFNWSGHAVVAIADVTGDGQGEIIFKASHSTLVPAAQRGRLIAYLNDGTELWVSDQRYDYSDPDGRGGGALSVADFNGDGTPEVYIGTQIFDAATGASLAATAATASAGCPYRGNSGCFWNQVTAVDMDDNGQLELVAGDTVYKVDLDNPDPAQRLTVWQQADASVGGIGDGWTAVADIDLDGTPDVIVVRTDGETTADNTILYVWDGQTGAVKGVLTGIGTGGGAPLLGDIDGDGEAEIVMVNRLRLRAYDFDTGTGSLVPKWTLTTNDGSALTSLAMFDFNNDGTMELVYRDEQDIRIIDGSGATALDLAAFACTSGTATEMPVIAALDGTRQARILVTCGTEASGTPNTRGVLRAFETASFPWANTRPVWNQQAYFVAHVNNDLSIPSDQFPHWESFDDPELQCSDGTNRPLNAFQQQVTDLDENTGCPVICTSFELNMSVGPCWRMLSSPVGVTYADMLENIWTQGVPGADYVGGTPNVLLWDNTVSGNTGGWIPPASLNDSIPPGTGFLVSVYADDDFDGVDDPFPKTLSVSGTPHTGDITPPMNTNPDGWTLVGNPYIEPVDFNSLSTTELTDIGYVYDRDYTGGTPGDTNGNTGGWRSTDGTYGDVTDGAFVHGQGFFVQNTDPAGSPSLTFTEASRTTGGEFYGKQKDLRDYLRLEVQGESLYNSMWIRFSENGSMEPVYGDALELDPLAEHYALLGARKSDGTLVDIGHFPFPDDALEIPVHAEATRPGSYTLTATDLDLPAATELYLHDLETGQTVAITESFEYTFTISQAAKATPDEGITSCSSEPAKAKTMGGSRFMITTSASGADGELPDEVALRQNYPNPFNPSTVIRYELPVSSEVRLEIFDLIGRSVATLVDGTVEAGVHQVNFDASHLTSGVYLYRLEAAGQIFTRKLTLIK